MNLHLSFRCSPGQSEHAVLDRGDPQFLSDAAEEAVHPCDLTEWPSHHRDLEGFNNHGGRRPRPPFREDAGICP